MKSILLYANEDAGLESRLQAALDLVRFSNGHLTCLHATPYDAFIMGDPFGGIYTLPVVMDQLKKAEDEQRARLEARLAHEDVAWDWLQVDGPAVQAILDRSRLADVVVLNLAGGVEDEPALSMTATVAIHARSPVLAVPRGANRFDGRALVLVAWNGSVEAAHALRLALPMLRNASAVHFVTVTEDRTEFPALDGCRYLALHGLEPEMHEWPREGRSVSAALLAAAERLQASCIVMGAYGHSRMREAVLGGVSRQMLEESPVPLLLGH